MTPIMSAVLHSKHDPKRGAPHTDPKHACSGLTDCGEKRDPGKRQNHETKETRNLT